MLPWGTALAGERDHIITLTIADGVGIGRFGDEVSFMKARSQRLDGWGDWPDSDDTAAADLPIKAGEIEPPLDDENVFVMGVLLPDVTFRLTGGGNGEERVLWLRRNGSNASIGFGAGLPTTVEGDAALIDDYATAVRWWYDNGQPGAGDCGLRVRSRGQYVDQQVWCGSPDQWPWHD